MASIFMHTNKMIAVETIVKAPIEKVWEYWNDPAHISGWAFASDAWEAKGIENDVQIGGMIKVRMSAKDKSQGFDFIGTYTNVVDKKRLDFRLDDGRLVSVEFIDTPGGIRIIELFEPEKENPWHMQQEGWQLILNNFKKYAEKSNTTIDYAEN